jgi:hypothetical protein
MQLLQDILSQGMCLTGVQILALMAGLTQTVPIALRTHQLGRRGRL